MLKKLKELCVPLPQSARHQSPLDNLAMHVFKHTREQEFVLSKMPPERRYLIDIDETMLEERNPHVNDFDKYGPNEKYLINKIFRSPSKLLYIVGGIGVGKTRFAHFLIDQLLPTVCHTANLNSSRCPCVIYIDFLALGDDCFSSLDFEGIKLQFSDILCNAIEAEIDSRAFFDLDSEVKEVWEAILSEEFHEYQKNAAFTFIQARLRTEEAGRKSLKSAEHEAKKRRKKIRKEVISNRDLRKFYLARLMRYIQSRFYREHTHCVMVIIDNIDREPQIVQRAVDLVIKPFARNSTCRVIVNVRQTTFHQGQGDSYSEPVDRAAYCGPTPLDVLYARLDQFTPDNPALQEFHKGHELAVLSQGMKEIRDHYLKRDPFKEFFHALCGRSVRKGLIIGQRLIHNSVYDPFELGKVGVAAAKSKTSDVLRALIIGTDDTFSYSTTGMVENVFQVHAHPGQGYLAKIRILKMVDVRGENGIRISDLVAILGAFGYSLELIHDAIQELLLKSKRLIWSDAVAFFDSPNDLLRHSNSRLMMTTIGKGYINFLFRRVEYVQEMMLDTDIPPGRFGSGGRWDYSRIDDRLRLVGLFCAFLLTHELEEIERFVQLYESAEYERFFGGSFFFSRVMLSYIARDTKAIVDFVILHSLGNLRQDLTEFRSQSTMFYEDHVIRARNAEARFFHH